MFSKLNEKRPRLSGFKCVSDVAEVTWFAEILPCFNLKGLSELSCTSTFFKNFWEEVKECCKHIDVNQKAKSHICFNNSEIHLCCSTVEKAMDLALVVSQIKPCTEMDPITIEMCEGEHEILDTKIGGMDVTCSHITFVGKGKDKTTVLGGFSVINKINVKFEEMTATNSRGHGLALMNSTAKVVNCSVKECKWSGMLMLEGTTATVTQCDFANNGYYGVAGWTRANARLTDCTMHGNELDGLVACVDTVVALCGEKTDIHTNKGRGIYAGTRGKVTIHLPPSHKTSHANGSNDDDNRFTGYDDDDDRGLIVHSNVSPDIKT